MKARVKPLDCTKCRQKVYAEAEEAFLKQQYELYKDMAYTFAVLATVADLSVHRFLRKRKPEYVKKLFEEICFMYDFPEIFGKKLDLIEAMKALEAECEIDFSKIKLHLETEKEFIKSAKKGDWHLE